MKQEHPTNNTDELQEDLIDEHIESDDADAKNKQRKAKKAKKTKTASKKKAVKDENHLPLFRFENEKTGEGSRTLFLYSAIAIALVVIFYIIGLLTHQGIFSLIAFSVAIIAAIVLFSMRKKMVLANKPIDEEEIDAEVEQYKVDLIDTFNGYDVPYTTEMILEAADNYREQLIQDRTSVTEFDPGNVISVLRSMASDSKKARADRKELMKKKRKSKKNSKKAKKNRSKNEEKE